MVLIPQGWGLNPQSGHLQESTNECLNKYNNKLTFLSLSFSVSIFLSLSLSINKLFLKDFMYLFSERGEGREKERERNNQVWLPLKCPHWGPDQQLRHVPWLGIKPATLWFTGQHSIHWATTARAINKHFLKACSSWLLSQEHWPFSP